MVHGMNSLLNLYRDHLNLHMLTYTSYELKKDVFIFIMWIDKSKVKISIPFFYSFGPSHYVRIYNSPDVVLNVLSKYLVYPPIVPNIFLGNKDISVENK